MFKIEFDAQTSILRIHVAGFWKPEDVPAFAKAVGARAQQARAVSQSFDVIVESLDFPVQANDVADMLTDIRTSGTALTSGRVAVVVGSWLNKLQAERTLAHPRLRVFMTLDEAENWLREAR